MKLVMITLAEVHGGLKGVEICRGAPSVSHRFFAYDSFIFCKTETHDCVSLKGLLLMYERLSGQEINLEKSSIAFSKNVEFDEQERLADLLGVQRVDKHDKYLGDYRWR